MINELKYQVRSREIVDLYSAMRSGRLTLSPYFQRNLVWRDAHKRDFIDTILRGYPFPQIFLARGPIDLDSMEACQCVVDGQQRLSAIRDYIEGRLEIGGSSFRDLGARQKEDFLKYEIAVIDFDLDAGDERLKEVFHRLNRTYYSLSAIEKISSEYSASEFLLVARLLSGEISGRSEPEELANDGDDTLPAVVNPFTRDPGVDDASWAWLIDRADGPYSQLIQNGRIFSAFEFDRKVPLMFTLNVMCTFLVGYFNRNDRVRRFLDEKNECFAEREEVIAAIDGAAAFLDRLSIPASSMWWNKANFFSLICELARNSDALAALATNARERLLAFEESVPSDYALAAREGVGRKGQRELRGKAVRQLLLT